MYLLPPEILEAVSSRVVEPVQFAYVDWTGGAVYAHTHVGELIYNNQIWLGVGYHGKIGGVTNDTNIGAHTVNLTLSAADPLAMNEVVTKDNIGRTVQLHIGFMDENGQLVGGLMYFDGRISEVNLSRYKDDGINISAVSKTADWAKSRPDRYTHGSYSTKPHGDDLFQYVDEMAQRDIGFGNDKGTIPLVPRSKR